MTTTVLGYPVSAPIGIAPTAMQKMAHEMGELATAKGYYHNDNIDRQVVFEFFCV